MSFVLELVETSNLEAVTSQGWGQLLRNTSYKENKLVQVASFIYHYNDGRTKPSQGNIVNFHAYQQSCLVGEGDGDLVVAGHNEQAEHNQALLTLALSI